jgi:hypothetical protein
MGGGAAARRCPYSDLAGSAAAGPNACAVCRRDGVRAAACVRGAVTAAVCGCMWCMDDAWIG